MPRLSDEIERFIKSILTGDAVELRRNEMAARFGCAPSQINYVLSTRFTPDHGYIIESRRGGGGYIRLIRIKMDDREIFLRKLYQRIGQEISREDAAAILRRLNDIRILTRSESILLYAALDNRTLRASEDVKRKFRAQSLRNIMNILLEGNTSQEEE